ncbi:MAG: hypothetical protein OXI58_11270 [Gemmatimonadota bacterium]|nr:hypothetical protein [Gemmatimonadota bacterium]
MSLSNLSSYPLQVKSEDVVSRRQYNEALKAIEQLENEAEFWLIRTILQEAEIRLWRKSSG